MHEAQALGSTRIADGELGPIEGSVDDAVVFGRYARDGCYAPELLTLLCALLASGDGASGTLLDVGAHIGLVSLGVARRSAARCLSFEPAPLNAALLARNVARHGLGARIEVHACALDEQAGTRALELSADNSGDHHLAPSAQQPADCARTVSVPARTLDAVLQGRTLPEPLVLKLDTQGAEARVLRGAAATLPRVQHAVIEFWPYGQHRIGEAPFALDALLCAGFPFAAVIEAGTIPPRLRATPDELDRLRWIARDGSDRGFFDLLLSRSETPLPAY